MKQIITGAISTPVKQPFTKYSLQHIQRSYKDIFNKIVKSQLFGAVEAGSPTDVYIISGLDNYAIIMPSTFKINAGMAYWNGDFYLLEQAVNVTTTGTTTLCVYIETAYITQDPIKMSDGSYEYVHQNKRLYIEGGVSHVGGSTNTAYTFLCNFSEMKPERLTYTQSEVDVLVNSAITYINNMQITIENNLADEAWKYPSFNPTYWKDAHDVLSSYQPSRYKKTHDGYLVMEFHVAGDGSGNMLATPLAAAYRPVYDTPFAVLNTANATEQNVVIRHDGQITSVYSGNPPFNDILHFYLRLKLD